MNAVCISFCGSSVISTVQKLQNSSVFGGSGDVMSLSWGRAICGDGLLSCHCLSGSGSSRNLFTWHDWCRAHVCCQKETHGEEEASDTESKGVLLMGSMHLEHRQQAATFCSGLWIVGLLEVCMCTSHSWLVKRKRCFGQNLLLLK